MSSPGRLGHTPRGGVFSTVLARPAGVLTASTAYPGRLRYALPAARTGQERKSARLTLRTSPDSPAGSADSHTLGPVTGASTESAVTHNTRPSLATTVPGTLSGALGSADHSVEPNAPAPGGALGSASSLVLTRSGTDSLRIWSDEVATAAHRPQLVLTFGAE